MTAARAYKDVIASVTAGLEAGADRNAHRVAELRRSVDELHKQMWEAGEPRRGAVRGDAARRGAEPAPAPDGRLRTSRPGR